MTTRTENSVKRITWSIFPLVALAAALLAGCASTGTVPDPAERQVLAPTGKLRVGVYLGSPTSMVRDPKSGESKGVSFDLGRELARRLGVPFEPVEYPRLAEVLEALKSGQVDFTVTNATAERAKIVDFTPPVLGLELGYLVLPGSPVAALADVDRPGIRVGVSQGSSSQGVLTREFRHAQVVPAPTLKSAIEMLSQHKVDAFATNKGILFQMSDSLPNARVLDGRWGLEHMAIAIPKGRDRGMAYMRAFAEDVAAQGLVAGAADRAGLRGTVNIQAR
jgi:polar amino acid transport system substrate-binding protein